MNDLVENKLKQYAENNNIKLEDFKKHGNKVVYCQLGLTEYYYKDDLICIAKTDKGNEL